MTRAEAIAMLQEALGDHEDYASFGDAWQALAQEPVAPTDPTTPPEPNGVGKTGINPPSEGRNWEDMYNKLKQDYNQRFTETFVQPQTNVQPVDKPPADPYDYIDENVQFSDLELWDASTQ